MTWVLYAGYQDRERAEKTFGELLEMGVASEDLSLATKASRPAAVEMQRIRRNVDNAQDRLADLSTSTGRIQEEGMLDVESAIGGGISTSSFNDDVSSVEEMDDASDVAENLVEPLIEKSFGSQDAEDAVRFAERGSIDSLEPTTPGFGTPHKTTHPRRTEWPFSADVVGKTVVIGDGPLATAMLADGLRRPETEPVEVLRRGLTRVGASLVEIGKLAPLFESRGAVLAVTETPGKIPVETIEGHVKASGAKHVRTYVLKEV